MGEGVFSGIVTRGGGGAFSLPNAEVCGWLEMMLVGEMVEAIYFGLHVLSTVRGRHGSVSRVGGLSSWLYMIPTATYVPGQYQGKEADIMYVVCMCV